MVANKDQAVRLLPARLNMAADAASRALERVFSRPRPQVTEDGVRQVMDLVWAAERFTAAQRSASSPAKYMDLSYLQDASVGVNQCT